MEQQKCRFQINHIDINAGFTINQHHQEDKEQDQHKVYLHRMEHRLELKTKRLQRPHGGKSSAPCIFKFIVNLESEYRRPNVISIGPYHRGNEHLVSFDDNKWYFLRKLVSRKPSRDLGFFLKEMRGLEAKTRECYGLYGDVGPVSSYDFVEMMLLDGCFVIEFLRLLRRSEDGIRIDTDDDPIFMRRSAIPVLIADLLKLENQLPFFVLESLFKCSRTTEREKELLPLITEAIQFAFPLPTKVSFPKPKHLLEFVYNILSPKAHATCTDHEKRNGHTSNESIQCVTQLRQSGIKFKPRKSVGFLDIKFKNGVLEIPTININDFTMNLITNCLAWEQCGKDAPTYFTDYIYFLNCLINRPQDVAFLCADEIITRHSRDDASVVSYFNNLGKNIVVFDTGNSYLLQEMREIEAYYCGSWATIMRTLSIRDSSSFHSPMPRSFS